MSLEQAKSLMKSRLNEQPFDGTIKFACGDDGVLILDHDKVLTEDADTPCTVTVSTEDLLAMIQGDLNPTIGFMQGKLKIDGDMGLALKLADVL
ncbi:MAG: SCP2 sterol-binding domain-containing protein [Gammaproteobacteria bacterium]